MSPTFQAAHAAKHRHLLSREWPLEVEEVQAREVLQSRHLLLGQAHRNVPALIGQQGLTTIL